MVNFGVLAILLDKIFSSNLYWLDINIIFTHFRDCNTAFSRAE